MAAAPAAYDAGGRLIQEARDGSPTTTWTYDNAGNRTSQTTAGQATSYTYDADNRLTSQATGASTTTFT